MLKITLSSFLIAGSLAFTVPLVRKTTHVSSSSKTGFALSGKDVPQSFHSSPRFHFQLDVGGRDYIDALLSGNKLAEVIVELKTRSSKEISSLSKDRFLEIFRVIEEQTKQVQENINDDGESFRRTSTARNDMTFMYKTLQSLGYLQIFGAATTTTSPVASSASTLENMYSETLLNLPAHGSKIVTPAILEMATFLPLSSLTPKPSNALFFAGSVAALLEIIFGLWTGIDYTLLMLSTLMAFLLDRLFFSGANVETLLRWLYPDSTRKIIHHEAGHFLLAYLLGCPVEGTVLSTWAALKDARFGGGSTNNRFPRVTVSAGTSFFDPQLSYEMNRPIPSIRRTSIDKYSIIVMGGIAAEAMVYGNAEGGAGDEAQLIAFLSNLYSKKSMVASDWTNIELIKNQARFGVLQAVLLLRLYRVCYDALVDTLERGEGSLGECIFAIEDAAKKKNLTISSGPIGYIEDDGKLGRWRKV